MSEHLYIVSFEPRLLMYISFAHYFIVFLTITTFFSICHAQKCRCATNTCATNVALPRYDSIPV